MDNLARNKPHEIVWRVYTELVWHGDHLNTWQFWQVWNVSGWPHLKFDGSQYNNENSRKDDVLPNQKFVWCRGARGGYFNFLPVFSSILNLYTSNNIFNIYTYKLISTNTSTIQTCLLLNIIYWYKFILTQIYKIMRKQATLIITHHITYLSFQCNYIFIKSLFRCFYGYRGASFDIIQASAAVWIYFILIIKNIN